VRKEGATVTLRPIAGTRPRGATREDDERLAVELASDPKELAEHVMLLDLGRNDVGHVASVGTVRVTEQMAIERYSHVMHIVSNVEGKLKPGLDAIDVLRSPSFGAMLGLGTLLFALFVVWVATAQAIYVAAFGYEAAAEIPDFVRRVLTTPQGWWLIFVGCGVGFLFAVVALCISVVSFPLMLDRHAGAGEAMVTSLRAVARNPVPMAAWGLIVAVLLVAGSLPAFLGLAVVIPLLGHATWHLYREVIAPDPNPRPVPPRPPRERRSAADFPAALFPWRRRDGG